MPAAARPRFQRRVASKIAPTVAPAFRVERRRSRRCIRCRSGRCPRNCPPRLRTRRSRSPPGARALLLVLDAVLVIILQSEGFFEASLHAGLTAFGIASSWRSAHFDGVLHRRIAGLREFLRHRIAGLLAQREQFFELRDVELEQVFGDVRRFAADLRLRGDGGERHPRQHADRHPGPLPESHRAVARRHPVPPFLFLWLARARAPAGAPTLAQLRPPAKRAAPNTHPFSAGCRSLPSPPRALRGSRARRAARCGGAASDRPRTRAPRSR